MSKDWLLKELESAENKWDSAPQAERSKLIEPYANAMGMSLFPQLRYECLPEVVQLILAMSFMPNEPLTDLAIKEGYLDFDTRAMINRHIIVAAIAGSINRGSTATETSAYRRTGTTRWFKKGSMQDPPTDSDDESESNSMIWH